MDPAGSPSRAPSIRRRLATLVIASAAPAVLLTAWLLALDYEGDRQTVEHDSIATARAMVHAVDRELVSLTLAAQVLSTSPHLQTGNLRAFHAQALELVHRDVAVNVALSDRDGRQLLNTLRPYGDPLPRRSNAFHLGAVFEDGRAAISHLNTGSVGGTAAIAVDVPVLRAGKVVYSLALVQRPPRFLALLQEQRLPQGWIGAVFDTTGTIVARTAEHERFLGKPGAPDLVRRMHEVEEGAVETLSLEGIPVLSAFSRSATTRWAVAIGIPRRALIASLFESIWLAAAAAVFTLTLSFGLVWYLGGRIAQSIRALAEPASRIGLKEEIVVPPLGLREADEVGQALVRASRMIANAEHRAHHDGLTGLANRVLFEELASRQVELARREEKPLSVLFVDLDGFKKVNDTFGHDYGDKLLCAVAERLTKAVRGSDVAARLGGDEFAVLLVHADAPAAAAVAGKLVEEISAPYPIDHHRLEVSASIGIATFPGSGDSAEELLKRADEAMYAAKTGGKRGYRAA